MFEKKLHWHSMIVHAIMALVPIAAIAFIFAKLNVTYGNFNSVTWQFITRLAIILVFLISVPSTFTGIADRNKMYAKWHQAHKIKLLFSLAILGVTLVELLIFFVPQLFSLQRGLISVQGFLLIIANSLIVFILSLYGLKITLGRQALAPNSYVPDYYNKKQPLDILDNVRAHIKEPPKTIDVFKK
jgi:hypothetical protein